jgi:hypothetical protein
MGFFSYRATEIPLTLSNNNLPNSIIATVKILAQYFFTVPVITTTLLLIVYLIVSKEKIVFQQKNIIVFTVSILYTLIITALAPYKDLRYSMVVFPFFIIFPVMLLQLLRNKIFLYATSILLCISFVCNSFNINNIAYVYKDQPDYYKFNKNAEVPVVVINKSFWKYASLVPYFNDKQQYIFYDKIENVTSYNNFWLITEASDTTINIPGNYEKEDSFDVEYFKCIKLYGRE